MRGGPVDDRHADLGRAARQSTIKVVHALELAAGVVVTAAGSFLAAKLTH
jgi:hypothetical protein